MAAYAARYWLPVTRYAERPERDAGEGAPRHPDAKSNDGIRRRASFRGRADTRALPRTCSRSGLRDAASLHRAPAMHRRTSAHGGRTGVLRANERFDWQAQIHSGLGASTSHPSRRTSAVHVLAVSGVPGGVLGHGAWASWERLSEGRLDSGHNVGSVSGYLYQSLPSAVQSRFVIPPQVSAHRRLRSEIPGDPAAGACRHPTSATSARRILRRFCGSSRS